MSQDQAQEPKCKHNWVWQHEPGRLIHWVGVCSLCGSVNWPALEREVRELISG